MTAISEIERSQVLHSQLYIVNQRGVIVGGLIQTTCLLGIMVISVIKPWGRRVMKQIKETQEAVSQNN
jgi:hypothetical protein